MYSYVSGNPLADLDPNGKGLWKWLKSVFGGGDGSASISGTGGGGWFSRVRSFFGFGARGSGGGIDCPTCVATFDGGSVDAIDPGPSSASPNSTPPEIPHGVPTSWIVGDRSGGDLLDAGIVPHLGGGMPPAPCVVQGFGEQLGDDFSDVRASSGGVPYGFDAMTISADHILMDGNLFEAAVSGHLDDFQAETIAEELAHTGQWRSRNPQASFLFEYGLESAMQLVKGNHPYHDNRYETAAKATAASTSNPCH